MKRMVKVLVIFTLFAALPLGVEAQTQLRDGRAVNGTIPRNGGTVSYRYTPTADGYLTIQTTGNTDTYLEIYEAQNQKIAEDDNSGQDNNAKIDLRVEAGKTYIIYVKGATETDRGRFSIIATIDIVRLQKELIEQRELEARLLREQEELAEQKRGYIKLYSDFAGTILVNGEDRIETIRVESEVILTIDDALNKDYTLAVREDNGTVHQAARVRIERTGSQNVYNVTITGPNAPEDFDVVQTANGITITRYKGTRTRVVIPQTMHGQRVTAIGGDAFSAFSNRTTKIASITFPNTITSIGFNAFYEQSLTGLILPNSLTIISRGAFHYCDLSKVDLIIPDTVTTIDSSAFSNCGLKKVTIGRGVRFIDIGAFDDNKIEELTIYAPLTTYDRRTEPRYNQTLGIAPSAFGRSQYLTRATLPANIHDGNLESLPESLVGYYKSQGKRAGTYVYNGQVWTRQ